MKDFIPCRKCLDKYSIPGYIQKELNGFPIVEECSCHKEWREKKDIIYRAGLVNIWNDATSLKYTPVNNYVGKESQKEILNVMKFVDNFDKDVFKSASLYFWGKNGTQKTTIAQWVGLSLLRKNYSVKYVTMQKFVRLLSELQDRQEKEEDLIGFKNVDFLILDESFSKEKVTLYKSGFQIPFIEDFLKERLELLKKSTLFISNIPVTEITKNGFSESIQSLIVRNTVPKGTVLEFRDEYYRNKSPVDIESIFNM